MTKSDTNWLEKYLETHSPREAERDIPVVPAGWPFTQHGALHISPEHLSRWIRGQGEIKTGPTAAAKILKYQGGTPSGLSQRTIVPGQIHQTYRFWRMPEPEPPQGGPTAQDAEGQGGPAPEHQAPEQQAPKEKTCQRCGAGGQYPDGDVLVCVDCIDELVSFQRVPCGCGAQAGEPCRTKSGKVISTAHKPRLAALDKLNGKEWEENRRDLEKATGQPMSELEYK